MRRYVGNQTAGKDLTSRGTRVHRKMKPFPDQRDQKQRLPLSTYVLVSAKTFLTVVNHGTYSAADRLPRNGCGKTKIACDIVGFESPAGRNSTRKRNWSEQGQQVELTSSTRTKA